MFDFTDRVVIVTGAAGNLGNAVAQAFQAAGANLVLVDRKPDRLPSLFPELAGSPDHFLATSVDLTDEEAVQGMAGEALERFGRVDVLVNAAGGWRGGKPVHETPLDTLDFLLNLNTRSVFISSRAVAPSMLDRGSGKIVNVAARAALGAAARNGAYSASKSAVVRLTETMAAELKHEGINVNCVLPGTIDTPQNRAVDAQGRPQSLGAARGHRRRDPLPRLRRGLAGERGRRPGLWPELTGQTGTRQWHSHDTAEHRRLADSEARRADWKHWGPYLSERAWGTVREDYSADRRGLGLFSPRPRPQPRLPLERGWPGGRQQPLPEPLPGCRPVERARPHPQGAALWPDRLGGQSRRGCQRSLLLSRQHAHPLLYEDALQVPPGRVPLCAARRGEPAAGTRGARVRAGRRPP